MGSSSSPKASGGNVYNIVLDHISVSWGMDENIGLSGSIRGYSKDITVMNSIISEGLHGPQGHGLGMLIGNRDQETQNIFLYGNLFAHNRHRHPAISEKSWVVKVNNVTYDQYTRSTHFYGGDQPQLVSIVGNVSKPGPLSDGVLLNYEAVITDKISDTSRIYVEDNLCEKGVPGDPWSCVINRKGPGIKAATPPVWVEELNPMLSEEVEAHVVRNAGARPTDRDPVDERVVADVMNGTGSNIMYTAEVGGWPVLAEFTRPFNMLTNPNGDDDGDGYTNLEEVLQDHARQVEP